MKRDERRGLGCREGRRRERDAGYKWEGILAERRRERLWLWIER